MNAGTRLGECTNQTLKTAMGKSLNWYQEGWENNLKITETPPDVLEVVKPDQNSFEDHPQAPTEKDVEVFDQMRLNIDKAQEKQKESSRSRIKKGNKCYEIRANDLVWRKDKRKARPGKPCCSFAPSWGHYLLKVTSVEANNLLQLEQLDDRPQNALTLLTSVKPNRQRPSTVRAQEVSLEELGVLPNTQTWIHMMSSITNHPPTSHYIIYSYCCCHYLLIKCFAVLYWAHNM
ncbi:uncharacterized protein [Salmo salar]|uniref:Uncharacterized protein LOC106580378 n=1 Tax=Salmo salar TaxID=8030 RepID=A0A1S3NN51_SALSA|nr:uncharacterized protein LOC106580378 [Salmo salar]XP_045559073.1 uncharacterized protein LOC106580378 [Salmo salar]XP_045559074.1 uncharacterized protein LOC106580378 [Salmo salar]XP_045559075.1 uncharacterized protein LOC106580378 [Salmo salar]|eukprot:XP_014016849.1 PREDICTED: uncharacterized protein LOC106580378 [Salmo salar]